MGRLAGILAHDKPAALLIHLGAVDLIEGGGVDAAAGNLRAMVQQCKANKTVPVLSTLLPMSGSHAAWAGVSRSWVERKHDPGLLGIIDSNTGKPART